MFLGLCLLASALGAQDFDNLQAERVATNLQYVDGLVWARSGFLVFSDVLKKKIYRLDPGKPPQPTDEDKNAAEGLAFDLQGRLYICEPLTRRVIRIDSHGKQEILADAYQGKKLNAPNDIAIRKDGNIYFTDPAFSSALDARELDFHGIFHITPKGEVEALAKWQTRPNGIALSASGKTLYVTDSDRHAVVAFDLDNRSGAGSNPRDVIHDIDGVPGGIRTDVNGRMYVGARGLGVYSPEGKLLHQLLTGETVTNCAFGDTDFETLYVSGRKSVYRIRLGVKGAIQY
ncbi:MAG: SMP-30/gluconolactonase/LRE family protein [Acidobacteriota bacterium]